MAHLGFGASQKIKVLHVTKIRQDCSPKLATIERWGLLAVLLYFALRIMTRTLISDTPEMDEGEQLLQSQAWQLGYGSQPPLYTWLQILCFGVFGKTIFALAFLKNIFLATVCVLAWRTGRELAGPRVGVAALCALFFVPQFVWYSQNDLTHSVLAQVFTAALMLVTLRMLRQPTLAQFVALGVIIAGGILSKYSFGALLGVVLGTLVTSVPGRKRLADWRMGLAFLLAVLLLAPHLNWVWHHCDWAFSEVDNLRVGGHKSILVLWGQGLVALLVVLVSYLLPLLAAFWLASGQFPKRTDLAVLDDPGKFLLRIFIGSLLAAVGAVIIFHATFNERWVQQNFYVLPLIVALILGPQHNEIRLRRLGTGAAVVAAIVFIALAGRVLAVPITHAPQKQNLPLAELASQLKTQGHAPAVIIAENFNSLGGALVMAFPQATVLESGQMTPTNLPAGEKLVVWREGAKPNALARIREVAARIGMTNIDFAAAQIFSAPQKYFPKAEFKVACLRLTNQ